MENAFSEEKYQNMLAKLFVRFPSFQKAGASASKPGIANMEFIDQLMGHPHKNYDIIHVAGTNGKGSVCSMLASVLKKAGYKTVFWSLAYVDWQNDSQPTREQAFSRLLPRTHNGAVVLLHSTSQTNAEILDELLTKWKEMGYRFGKIEELFK